MISAELKSHHFESAIQEIEKNGVPKSRESYIYDLLLNGKKYPPKYVISIAHKYLTGKELSPNDFNAVTAKDYFIRNGYQILDNKNNKKLLSIKNEDIESAFPEGKEKYKLHRTLERDSSIGKKAKENRMDTVGELRCDVCDFSFSDKYGELGGGFIEAHHTVPVSQLKGDRKTNINEMALVCSNCHRMLHSGKELLSISELKNIVNAKYSKNT
jgi:predicted HNH restriction endonuclease